MPEDRVEPYHPARRPGVLVPFSDLLEAKARKRTLLLIDDDPSCARFLGHAAEECGFTAVVTISPQSFKAQYKDSAAEVVVVDLAMPGADGIELLRFLAGENCTALVLIVSGFDGRVVESAIRLGSALGLRMGRALTKPVRLNELWKAILEQEEGSDVASVCL